MDGPVATCEYVYTVAEFKLAMRSYWMRGPRRWWLWMLALLVIFILSASIIFAQPPPSGSRLSNPALQLLLNSVPAIIVAAVLVIAFLRIGSGFKKTALYNRKIQILLAETCVVVKTDIVSSELKWGLFSDAIESRDGFILIHQGGRIINWLPKSGFAVPMEIELTRQILLQHTRFRASSDAN